MQKPFVILSFFLPFLVVSCSNPSVTAVNDTKPLEDISILSYNFITDTAQIKILIKDKISPTGLPFQAKDLVNQFVKINLKNNTKDTIYFSNSTANIPSPIDSIILSYCPVSFYSLDSINWERPPWVSDFWPTFQDTVFSNQTVTRFLYIDPYKNSNYFKVSMHFQINDTLRTQYIILKK